MEILTDKKFEKYIQKINKFECEKMKILMTHIGGYPKKYIK